MVDQRLRTACWLRPALGITAGALMLLACGGQSNSDDDDSGPTGASGGTASTSAGASSGAGGTANSNSNSSGGSASTGAGGGPTSASNGTTNGSGGSATAAGGSAGMGSGGGGVMNPVPDPELVDACAESCALQLEADCPSGPTEASCAGACELITRVPVCESTYEELFDCIEEDDTTSCSGEGDVVFDHCVNEQLSAYTCVLDEAPNEALEEPCEDYCGAAVGAGCANDANDLAGCIVYCQSIGTILPACESEWRSLLECGHDAEFTCNDEGEAEAMGCDVEALLFFACMCDSSPELCGG